MSIDDTWSAKVRAEIFYTLDPRDRHTTVYLQIGIGANKRRFILDEFPRTMHASEIEQELSNFLDNWGYDSDI